MIPTIELFLLLVLFIAMIIVYLTRGHYSCYSNDIFCEICYDKNIGYRIGKRGSLHFILGYCDKPITCGFQEFSVDEGGVILGHMGTSVKIVINSNGELNPQQEYRGMIIDGFFQKP